MRRSFLKGNRIINELELRASIGTVGNQEIGDYRSLATYGTTSYYFGGVRNTGYVRNNLENPDLKWETTASYNIGFDLSLLNDRLHFVFDAYYKKTSDLLLSIPVEQTTGFSSQLKNIGNVTNKGIELAVNANIIQQKNLSWDFSANIAHNKNKVTSIGTLDNIISGATIIKEGEPLGSFYGWVFDGIVQQGDDLRRYHVHRPSPVWSMVMRSLSTRMVTDRLTKRPTG